VRTCPYCAMAIPSDAIACPQCGRDLSGTGAFQDVGYRVGAQASIGLGLVALLLAGYGAHQVEWGAAITCGLVGLGLLGVGAWLLSRVRRDT